MPFESFIPEMWSAVAEHQLQKALVYGQTGVVNRNYEGLIQDMGDSVTINGVGTITISDYTKGMNIGVPETPSGTPTKLLIDQGKYYNFQIDDVDKVQANVALMDEYIIEAQYGMADVVDQYISTLMAAAVPTANTVGSTGSPKDDMDTVEKAAYNYLVDLGVILDDNKVPRAARWVVVPPWFHGYLQKDDRFVKSGTALGDATLRNGVIGQAAGFDILLSHNVPKATSTTVFKIVAGARTATTFADQLVKTEAYRHPEYFADAMKGIHVYGAKVVHPSRLAMLIANVT